MTRIAILLGVAVIALGAVSTDGSATTPSAATRATLVRVSRTFEHAWLTGDGRVACRALSPAGLRRLQAREPREASCPAQIAALRAGNLVARAWKRAGLHVALVVVHARNALVYFGRAHTRVFEFVLAESAHGAWGVSAVLERSSHFTL